MGYCKNCAYKEYCYSWGGRNEKGYLYI
jgi:hypothetical protein